MNIKITSNIQFSVTSIQYTPNGVLCISLSSGEKNDDTRYQYEATLGNGQAEKKASISLLQYARDYAATSNIKPQTKSSYYLMCKYLERYGNCIMDKITTAYLQEFITYLQSQGLKAGTVRLYFQKLACVLHDAYNNELFDDRILRRVKRPKREQVGSK